MSQDILVVDDEPDIRELIGGVLEDEGYSVRMAATAQAALQEVSSRAPALVILDVWLHGSDMDGLSVLKHLKAIDPMLPVIVISGHGNVETAIAAIRRGAYDFIEKPFKTNRLLHLIERALESAELKRENQSLRPHSFQLSEWIGKGSAATNLRQTIEKIAPTNSRIMISGEAGVGKELCAKLIHDHSNRSDGPFVAINASNSLPEQIESVLFGEESADGLPTQLGAFEKAHGGTLLLDEVGDMPLNVQSKILRVLTEQRFNRVGGRSDVVVDIRVMSTTTRNLKEEIAAGRFREDLFYRLNVVSVNVPSLAERREDIPALVSYFSERIAGTSGMPTRVFSDEALAVLQSRAWQGNVRQLKNFVERVLILSRDSGLAKVSVDELPSESSKSKDNAGHRVSADLVGLSLRDAREQFEREYLSLQITRFDGNISRTAEFIGMERSALHRKLKALGVDTSASRSDTK